MARPELVDCNGRGVFEIILRAEMNQTSISSIEQDILGPTCNHYIIANPLNFPRTIITWMQCGRIRVQGYAYPPPNACSFLLATRKLQVAEILANLSSHHPKHPVSSARNMRRDAVAYPDNLIRYNCQTPQGRWPALSCSSNLTRMAGRYQRNNHHEGRRLH
jgi:hypothetical protein